jgi:hypothetical protein
MGERAKQLQDVLKINADFVDKEPATLAGYNVAALVGYESREAGELGLLFHYNGSGRSQSAYLRYMVVKEAGANGKIIHEWKTADMKPFKFVNKGTEATEKSGRYASLLFVPAMGSKEHRQPVARNRSGRKQKRHCDSQPGRWHGGTVL